MAPEEIEDQIQFKSHLTKVFEKAPSGREVLTAVRITVHGSARLTIKKIPSNPTGIAGLLNIEEFFEADWTIQAQKFDHDVNALALSYENSELFLWAKDMVAGLIKENWLSAVSKAKGESRKDYIEQWLRRRLHPEHDGHPTVINPKRPLPL